VPLKFPFAFILAGIIVALRQWRSQPKNFGGSKKLGGRNVWF